MIDLLSLMVICAPFVDPRTMHALVMTESNGNHWAININRSKERVKPTGYLQAVTEAKRLIDQGHSIDMGLSQINSKTMKQLGITVEQVFDPCTNIYAGATVLWRFYMRAEKKFGSSEYALHAAFSAYNTGNFEAGFKNGYVARVLQAAQ